jgi:hypothetical protein
VLLRCDGCRADVPATVSFIATEPEYTPPVIYSNETRAKLVFLVEARPAPEAAQRLRPGPAGDGHAAMNGRARDRRPWPEQALRRQARGEHLSLRANRGEILGFLGPTAAARPPPIRLMCGC